MPMLKKIIVFIAVLCSMTTAHAQKNIYDNIDTTASPIEEVVEPPVEEEVSTYNNETSKLDRKYFAGWGEDVLADTAINFRTVIIAQDSIYNWRKENKYAWIKNIDSALRAAKNKDKQKPQEPIKEYDNSPSSIDNFFNSSFLQVFLWIAAISFVGFIIYHLFLSKGIFGKASKRAKTDAIEEEVIDHLDNDFDSLYNRAYAAGDTRLAMRYLFLKLLKKLDEKELIQFAADKTNSIYAREMPPAKRNNFAQIALYYEYIWYGNAAVSAQTFDTIRNKVNEFLNSI
jgi:hypothetical protein